MSATLDVQRMGHLNLYAEDYDAALTAQRDIFGAKVFREWEEAPVGGRNALWLVGANCFEVFAPSTPDLAIGRWIAKNGPSWHSMEWTVPSLSEAIEVVTARGLRITDSVEGGYIFTHPRDLHGVCLELTDHHFDDDDRDRPGWQATQWSEEHPLGIIGGLTVKVASTQPEVAAAAVAALVGRDVYVVESPQLNSVSHGIAFPDHNLEFVASRTDSTDDLIGGFIQRRGERMFCATFTVKDIYEARKYLTTTGVRFSQFGQFSLLLDPSVTHGALIELSAAGHSRDL